MPHFTDALSGIGNLIIESGVAVARSGNFPNISGRLFNNECDFIAAPTFYPISGRLFEAMSPFITAIEDKMTILSAFNETQQGIAADFFVTSLKSFSLGLWAVIAGLIVVFLILLRRKLHLERSCQVDGKKSNQMTVTDRCTKCSLTWFNKNPLNIMASFADFSQRS